MIANTNRQGIVDAIRGFSLLGILLANMLIFQYGMWGKDELELFKASSFDHGMHTFVKIVIEGSFMPIFTFLFGYGLFKMMEGLETKGLKPKRVLVRRFLMLLGLGLLHSTFVWDGDILFFYGMIGFFLLLFLKRKAKTVLIWGIVLISLFGLLGLAGTDPEESAVGGDPAKLEQFIKDSIPVYSEGTYAEIMKHRSGPSPMDDMGPIVTTFMLLLAPIMMAPMFLFGIYAAKKNWFLNPEEKRKRYLKGAILWLILGYALKSLKFIWPDFILSGVGELIGGSILALGYLLGAAWVLSHVKASRTASRFAAVGKLSLTNYLMQSVICTAIFYGYGLGLFGKIGIAGGIGIALLVYTVQLICSVLYLKRFKIGPIEWLLRSWTYWSWRGKPKTNALQPVEINA
ncbi:DUF418 domain-containing protein [Paenibacillus sp. GSMTC-2017]|uniref:DUF418 domain-containing protein n=1 Tax=Paenibacillus sp. GSMTC-2017 TaxID=2794350 RepID=UPI0018D97EF7|nr:DUF418 domain-containing protein [Paenibacillus sp. GSMTC-2017]MBH5318601.1 DUF418 domain-containing protein [Paenibacillus sp. GSMTC-2017]